MLPFEADSRYQNIQGYLKCIVHHFVCHVIAFSSDTRWFRDGDSEYSLVNRAPDGGEMDSRVGLYEATAECRTRGAQLATIHTTRLNNMVIEWLVKQTSTLMLDISMTDYGNIHVAIYRLPI